MPRLTSLRLEGSLATDVMDDQDMLLGSISSLTALETLHIGCFISGLGHQADVAAALRPLHRLRALVRGCRLLAYQLNDCQDMHRLRWQAILYGNRGLCKHTAT